MQSDASKNYQNMVAIVNGLKKLADLIVLLVIASFALILNIVYPNSLVFVKYISVALLIFFIPGYMFLSAISRRTDFLETIVLSIGLSIMIIVVLGAVLMFTPIGFTLHSASWAIALFVFIFTSIAVYRRLKEPIFIKSPELKVDFSKVSEADKLAVILITITLCTGGFIAFYIFTNLPYQPETRFYLLNANRTFDIPGKLKVGDNLTVVVGIINNNPAELEFNLTGRFGNRTIFQKNFTLYQNEQREFEITFNVTETGRYKLNFDLYHNGIIVGSVYRWVEVTSNTSQVVIEMEIFKYENHSNISCKNTYKWVK